MEQFLAQGCVAGECKTRTGTQNWLTAPILKAIKCLSVSAEHRLCSRPRARGQGCCPGTHF